MSDIAERVYTLADQHDIPPASIYGVAAYFVQQSHGEEPDLDYIRMAMARLEERQSEEDRTLASKEQIQRVILDGLHVGMVLIPEVLEGEAASNPVHLHDALLELLDVLEERYFKAQA